SFAPSSRCSPGTGGSPGAPASGWRCSFSSSSLSASSASRRRSCAATAWRSPASTCRSPGDPPRRRPAREPMSAPVAITGLGAVSGFGWGVPALWDGLLSGRTAIGNFRRFDHTAYRTHVAAEVPALPTLSERRDQRLTLADRFALAAAAEALAGARLPAALGPSAGL